MMSVPYPFDPQVAKVELQRFALFLTRLHHIDACPLPRRPPAPVLTCPVGRGGSTSLQSAVESRMESRRRSRTVPPPFLAFVAYAPSQGLPGLG